MFANFREAFMATTEELKRWNTFAATAAYEDRKFLLDLGFSEADTYLLYKLEVEETKRLLPFQNYVSRVNLLRYGLTSTEKVKEEIESYREDEAHASEQENP